MSAGYIGRFAPTPSGPLHFGSVITALASFLDARKHGGLWQLRIDDLDPPRVRAGAIDSILHTLEQLGLEWDGPVIYQHSRIEAYQAALDTLTEKELVYRCYCTRQQTRGIPYPGTCRTLTGRRSGKFALRVKTDKGPVSLADRIQGNFSADLHNETGDFIIRRSDRLFAYHIAVVTDDAWQGVTDIVRGADLLDTTPAQIYLQTQLGLPVPRYAHLPVATDPDGNKISKRDAAMDALLRNRSAEVLSDALLYLGQPADHRLTGAKPAEIMMQAIEQWDLSTVPKLRKVRLRNP